MSMVVSLRRRGLRVAYALTGGIAAWMGHLFFASSFVRYTCNTRGTTWGQHVATAVFALITIHAGWVAYGLYREGQAATEDAGTPPGANHFVGIVGIILSAANLLLILGEGSMVGLIHPACHP
jgi:hypothetical protein